jgi:hypothetical protein
MRLLFAILEFYEEAELKSYKESDEESKKGHIYLKLKKLRKILHDWSKAYRMEKMRWIILGTSEFEEE